MKDDELMAGKLSTDKQYYSTQELHDSGFSYYKITKLTDSGQLIKMNRSMYENTSYQGDSDDFSTVSVYIPKGVICMLSAARFYGLTDYLPDAVDVAIGRTMKVSTRPVNPPVNIWFFPDDRYKTCIKEEEISGRIIRIYDIEKTVVDILYYRNKTGIEETREILTNYLRRSDRDLVKLHDLAQQLGCGRILGTYLEVLL